MGKITVGKIIAYWANCYGFGSGVVALILGIVNKELFLVYLGVIMLVACGFTVAQYWKETYPK
jgi:hypothetical protein